MSWGNSSHTNAKPITKFRGLAARDLTLSGVRVRKKEHGPAGERRGRACADLRGAGAALQGRVRIRALAELFEHGLFGKPVPTFPGHAP